MHVDDVAGNGRLSLERGLYFGERWAQTRSGVKPSQYCGNEFYYEEWDLSRAGCDLDALEFTGNRAKCFDCSAARCGGGDAAAVATHFGCVASSPQFDAGNTDSNDNAAFGEKFFIKLPARKQDDGATEVAVCPDPFTCDYVHANGTSNSAQHALCKVGWCKLKTRSQHVLTRHDSAWILA